MKQPFDLTGLRRRLAVQNDPHGPVPGPLPHEVRLPAPTTEKEQDSRWCQTQFWCRENVNSDAGDQWTRRTDPATGEVIFGFTDVATAVWFKLLFR
jgi:hypothetical protein